MNASYPPISPPTTPRGIAFDCESARISAEVIKLLADPSVDPDFRLMALVVVLKWVEQHYPEIAKLVGKGVA